MKKSINKSARGLYRGSIVGTNGKAIVVTAGSFKKKEDAEAVIDRVMPPNADRMAKDAREYLHTREKVKEANARIAALEEEIAGKDAALTKAQNDLEQANTRNRHVAGKASQDAADLDGERQANRRITRWNYLLIAVTLGLCIAVSDQLGVFS